MICSSPKIRCIASRPRTFPNARLHSDYGLYLGRQVRAFVERNRLKADMVASHGQTIFHQPSVRFTAQIGSGAGIAAECGIDTV
ncbi:MAG: anhydro-N-acetylmuramic acid kinase, partial [Firmicutes bacterium]|nr:anhydro-N-acetylmuramic acid kinase [Bacillota bacterium]